MKKLSRKRFFLAAALPFFLLCSCSQPETIPGEAPGATRSMLMGFTPWMYEASIEAMNWTYRTLSKHGDIVSHHMEDGVPWQECLESADFPASFQAEIDSRTALTPDAQRIVLSINPLNIGRNGLAPHPDPQCVEPPHPSWDERSFDSPEVKAAYLAYARRMVEAFAPEYLILGIEANLLVQNAPAKWNAYMELHRSVYSEIKKEYPDLPLGVSVFCVPFFPEWTDETNLDAQLSALRDLEGSADFIAFSVHPFMSSLTCEAMPVDYCSRLFALTDKPVAVSESSYPAQKWELPGTPPSPKIAFNGSERKQAEFLSQLLDAANAKKALFAIWFASRDYDVLWENTLGSDPLALVWRDTGLYDEGGGKREAMSVWDVWLGKPLR